ncbi:MAG: thioredoxin domain-containing protein [Pseudomonadota bacterium]
MNRILLLAIAAVVVIGGGAYYYVTQQQGPASTEITAPADIDSDVDTSGVLEMSLGNPDAPVTVIEYASFTCPHCRDFHKGTYQDLKAQYIDTGKINFIYREVYFDLPGLWAGMVARCGGPDRYFGISDLIYQDHPNWVRGANGVEIAENLRRIGRTAGLTDAQLDACLQDNAKAEALNAVFEANARADGINSTPSFVINGELYSNMSLAEFQRIIDAELEG